MTAKEMQLLDCLCVFEQNKEIARYLGLAPKTVMVRLQTIYGKLATRFGAFDGHPRTRAMRMWHDYWLTDAAKATLRNPLLTRNKPQ